MPIVLPTLPYPFDALEPHIDAKTMQIHHDKHHKAYVDGFNKTEEKLKLARDKSEPAEVGSLEKSLAFFGGGHILHTMFWLNMAPAQSGGGKEPTGLLADRIRKDFGDFAKFKQQFTAAAVQVEGNGWAWLTWHPLLIRLHVQAFINHQNGVLPGSVLLMGIDVWEHAYYLKHQNDRAGYVADWFSICNWPEVERRFGETQLSLGRGGVLAAGAPNAAGPDLKHYPNSK